LSDVAQPRRIAIVGAGLAGMAAAHAVAQAEAARMQTQPGSPSLRLTLFEASSRLGGTIETIRRGGFTIECGPDSWVSDKPAMRQLALHLGLGDQLIPSNDALRRNYLVQGRALMPMPDGLRMMVPTRWLPILESPLFSWQARLAYLREPKRAAELKNQAAARAEGFDESVRAFVERHFGAEATEKIAGPLLAGVFGGDIDKLSAGAVLAPFVQLERLHGSLIAPMMEAAQQTVGRAAQAEAKQSGDLPAVFTTLRDGLGTLIDAIARVLPRDCIQMGVRVTGLRREGEYWQLQREAGGSTKKEVFDAVVLATPAPVTRELLRPHDAEAAALLEMEATSAIVVALCWSPEASSRLRIPRGFGFLVPPGPALGSEPTLLAGTFMHQKFAHRAPEGAVFLRGFFGGEAAVRMMDWTDEAIADAARAAFARLLGPLPAAQEVVVRRWPLSLPQYHIGHPVRMAALAERMRLLPGLVVTGNAYQGVGLPAIVQHAQQAIAALLAC
jgi:oxygen-dependent protoporphyrinogen oxidase